MCIAMNGDRVGAGETAMKGGSFGLIGNLIVGALAAIFGGYLFGSMAIFTPGLINEIVCATIGAILLLFLLSFVPKRR